MQAAPGQQMVLPARREGAPVKTLAHPLRLVPGSLGNLGPFWFDFVLLRLGWDRNDHVLVVFKLCLMEPFKGCWGVDWRGRGGTLPSQKSDSNLSHTWGILIEQRLP